MAVVSAAFFGGVISLAVRSQLRKPVSGTEGMIGETGEAVTDFNGKGKVWVVGELWDARSDLPVRKGDKVVVTAREGMTLTVSPASR
jgi:membrane-bound serine protease (ClpP class)